MAKLRIEKVFKYRKRISKRNFISGITAANEPELLLDFGRLADVHDEFNIDTITGSLGIHDDPSDEHVRFFLAAYAVDQPTAMAIGGDDKEWSREHAWRVLSLVGVVQTMEHVNDQNLSLRLRGGVEAPNIGLGLFVQSSVQSHVTADLTIEGEYVARQYRVGGKSDLPMLAYIHQSARAT